MDVLAREYAVRLAMTNPTDLRAASVCVEMELPQGYEAAPRRTAALLPRTRGRIDVEENRFDT
jgi:hypothetical protein